MCRWFTLLAVVCNITQRGLCIDQNSNETARNDYDVEEENLRREQEARENISRTLDNVLRGYNRNIRPNLNGPPTVISADIFALSIGPIIEVDMEFKIDVFFRQRWVDNRLRFNGSSSATELRLNTIMLESIWFPDTYFINGKSSKRHIVTTPNAMFRVKPDGSVLYTQRLTIVASCVMQLHKYPMDTQVCPLEFSSNSYSTMDVVYQFKTFPNNTLSVVVDDNATMAQYTLIRKYHAFHTTKVNDRIGNRSVLTIKFTFVRHVGFFLIQTYIPCVLIVILSWVSFFLNREATPARVALGIMAILTITTMGWSSKSVLPKVSYAKAVDWFNVLCFAFVFGALIEFACVNYFTKRRAGSLPGNEDNEDEDDNAQAESEKVDAAIRRKKRFTLLSSITRYNIKVKDSQDSDHPSLCSDFLNCLTGNQEYRERRIRKSRNSTKSFNSVSKIDEVARIMFPLSFVIINAIFWVAYSF